MLQGESNLFARVADGDESAFTTIFSHYVPRIQSFLFKMVKSKEAAEEIVHDVFLSLWINREKLPAIENYQAYIFTAATNKTYTYLKKRGREEKGIFNIQKTITEEINTTEETINFREINGMIRQAIEMLPPQRKLVLKLSREEGLSHDEISAQLKISKNTVKNQIVHALQFIKQHIQTSSGLPVILVIGKEIYLMIFHQ